MKQAKRIIIIVLLLATCSNLWSKNGPITGITNNLLNAGTTFFSAVAGISQNEETKMLVQTFILIDQISCLEPDLEFYFRMYKDQKNTECNANIEYIQIETNLMLIAMKTIEVMKKACALANIDYKSALANIINDFEFFGISAESIAEKTQEESAKTVILDVNELLKETISLIKNFNSKYERLSDQELMRYQMQYKLKKNSPYKTETN